MRSLVDTLGADASGGRTATMIADSARRATGATGCTYLTIEPAVEGRVTVAGVSGDTGQLEAGAVLDHPRDRPRVERADLLPARERRDQPGVRGVALGRPRHLLLEVGLHLEELREVGVVEKCTFCVQRIKGAMIQAKADGREVRDGEIQTACAQSCPTRAIVFGDLADSESAVHRASHGERRYRALNELNTPDCKIISVEDPVEYRLDGVNQVQVNEKIDLSFGRVLRSAGAGPDHPVHPLLPESAYLKAEVLQLD